MSHSRMTRIAAALLLAPPCAIAASAHVPPPLSVPRAKFFAAHPAEYAAFLAHLPPAPAGDAAPTRHRFLPPAGSGTWSAVAKAPAEGLCNPVLLTDGSVMIASGDTPHWYKLTPNQRGDYAHGTWSQLADLPVVNGEKYAPLYHATGLLPDGRVIVMGGEYNHSNHGVWTKLGAIYDPVANSWTGVDAPTGRGWEHIGDAESTVLANGTFMLASCCGYPDVDALLQPKTLSWVATGAPNEGGAYQDEQGYELLPNNTVLTVDVWTFYPAGGAVNAEEYNPKTHVWTSGGILPVSLVDPAQCGTWEIGPAVLRGDGTVVGFGANTGCTSPAQDPTAILDVATTTWTTGPIVPSVCGANGTTPCDLADAPAALLPDGNILFAASSGYGDNPTHFFEFSSTNSISQVADTLYHADQSGAYEYNFLVLPTGQILSTDFSRNVELYTSSGSAIAAWAPTISTVPSHVAAGHTYKITGTQLGGVSQGAYYGDDAQMATNYPIVQITHTSNGHVFYARTTDMKPMSVTPGVAGSARFSVPTGIETGPASLVVIANGIASAPVSIRVH
jgi:hypothetical protein